MLADQPVSINMDSNAIEILDAHHGGLCFEVNLLRADVLYSSGFDITLRKARVGSHPRKNVLFEASSDLDGMTGDSVK